MLDARRGASFRSGAKPPKGSKGLIATEPKVTRELAAEHGLSAEEYGRILKILGRDPSITELGIFSVMWSEHCSYKSSKVHLKRLPTRANECCRGRGRMPESWISATDCAPLFQDRVAQSS